ncbi:bifunctional helix-turn-helix transcriptional regulator/GNAT family N-acetyltransferase [Sneathiella glossodoripedis]|uniref:bifunctional helix-turn-helix transcriptional regulator/GNAT family N-acetyltransferase n=1 Tax=Sneathiella glossodoripedis TaxID=418853 RepID=UPI00047122FB|nr:helix-turn-helix domain-containing GNAT family N-acetyltransferase [Sneathiella glossodoripedis]
MLEEQLIQRSAYMRQFTRFYTQKAGVLDEALLGSPYNLTEARLIYELAQRNTTTAQELCSELNLDPGYISRCLNKFQKKGLILKTISEEDRRKHTLSLTDQGLKEFAKLDRKSSALFQNILSDLSETNQQRLVSAMEEIEKLLNQSGQSTAPVILRPHGAGDMGWIIQAHGEIYSKEYGWSLEFEQLVAQIAADFLKNFNPEREICWIAELAGQRIGSAMVVEENAQTAKLRLVILDPIARGRGVGKNLVEQCLNFARQAGYSQMSLWTNSNLHAAIAIYKKLGFKLQSEEKHHSFGKDLVGQHWSRPL